MGNSQKTENPPKKPATQLLVGETPQVVASIVGLSWLASAFVWDCRMSEKFCLNCICPPWGPAHSAGLPQNSHKLWPFMRYKTP